MGSLGSFGSDKELNITEKNDDKKDKKKKEKKKNITDDELEFNLDDMSDMNFDDMDKDDENLEEGLDFDDMDKEDYDKLDENVDLLNDMEDFEDDNTKTQISKTCSSKDDDVDDKTLKKTLK